MSINHKAQLLGAKADFVKKLTAWINQTTENLDRQSNIRLVEAGLMQRILDVHACREKTTQNVYLFEVNRFFMPYMKETDFMKLRQISSRDTYLATLFNGLWSKKEFTKAKDETRELIKLWIDNPRYRKTFPYSLLEPEVRDSRPRVERPKQQPPKQEPPKQDLPKDESKDAWDDDEDTTVKQTPAEEFAALAKEFGVPFQKGDNIIAAYKRLSLLMHPDKHPADEAVIWTARMQKLNALRETLE